MRHLIPKILELCIIYFLVNKHFRNEPINSVANIWQQVDDEFSFQRHLERFRDFPANNVADPNVEGFDAWIVAKLGFATSMEFLSIARNTISLPAVERERLLVKFFPSSDAKYSHLLETVARRN